MKAKEKLVEERRRPASSDSAPPIATSVIGVSKRFGKTGVLENINFDVAEGELLVLLGASGSGKTTILRIIAGLEQPNTGRVVLHGRDVTDLPARERGVGVIFQSYALFPKMTVEKNIGYGLRIRRRRRKEIRKTVDELLSLVQLEEHRKKYPSQLSGGQQQRVAIARTLAYKPEVLLFDEPFGALDTQTRTHLRREIRALLRRVNVPAIFITHDQEEALELGDRVAVVNKGHIEQIGTPYEIYNRPATEYVATFLGAANILEGVVREGFIQTECARLPVQLAAEEHYRVGEHVKIVFRPEDVVVGRADFLKSGHFKLAPARVEEVTFIGAYERLRLRLEQPGSEECAEGETPYYLTTDTPESQPRSIVATRPKPEATSMSLRIGDRVIVAITSFSVLRGG